MKQKLLSKFGIAAACGVAAVANAQVSINADQAALGRIASDFRIRAQAEKEEALRMAPLWGIPVQELRANGQYLELMAIRNNKPVYFMTDNVNAARSTRTNLVTPGGALGYNLTGNGIVIGQWDGGTDRPTHQELTGRIVLGDGEALSGDHATHVGGTMIAKGIDPNARGMASKATIRSYGWNSDIAEMAAAVGSFGVMISNHSYGYVTGWSPGPGVWRWYGDTTVSQVEDPGFGIYDATAQAFDQVAYNSYIYLPVHSAGNDRGEGPASQPVNHQVWNGSAWVNSNTVRQIDGAASGYDTIPYTATAKNILTVGAVNDVPNYTGPASVVMSSFSGWGPTDDGRIKPDLVGNGVGLYSSAGSSNTAYATMSGTSMSSPNVAGSLALLLQQYPPLHGGNPMLSSTLKALAIHTASECGVDPGPDYRFGWGLLDMGLASQLVVRDSTLPEIITEHSMSPMMHYVYYARSDGNPLRATMAWTDPPGPINGWVVDQPSSRLMNDLDMRVFKGATTFRPWVLDPAAPNAAAAKGDNFRDNVEQILINSPTAGDWYRLEVQHKGAGLVGGSQLWSLIATGFDKILKPIKLSFAPGSLIGCFPSNGEVVLNDVAPPGGLLLNLTYDSTKVTGPATILVPAGVASAKFKVNTGPVTSTQIRKVTVSWMDISVQGKLTLNPGGLQAFTMTPKTLTGGGTSTGTVTLSGPAPVGGQKVLLSSDTTRATLPASVTVPEAGTQATFTATFVGRTTSYTANISAKMGTNTIVRPVVVNP